MTDLKAQTSQGEGGGAEGAQQGCRRRGRREDARLWQPRHQTSRQRRQRLRHADADAQRETRREPGLLDAQPEAAQVRRADAAGNAGSQDEEHREFFQPTRSGSEA